MGAFLGISVWVALATVVPGLITIAVIFGAFVFAAPDQLRQDLTALANLSDWVVAGWAVACMVLTQALGILLERRLVRQRKYGDEEIDVVIAPGIDRHGVVEFTLHPYAEYDGIYLLLAELGESEDAQGHLKRILAQFFLSNNTLISFSAGIVTTLVLLVSGYAQCLGGAWLYLAALCACLAISFQVAKIRFEVMAKGLWAARRRRLVTPPEAKE